MLTVNKCIFATFLVDIRYISCLLLWYFFFVDILMMFDLQTVDLLVEI